MVGQRRLALPHLVGRPVLRLDHHPLAGGHGQRSVGDDAPRQFARGLQRLAGFGQLVDQAIAVGAPGREHVAGQRQLQRDAVGQLALQAHQAAGRGRQPALDLGHAELRIVGRHHQVAGQHQFEAAGQRIALHRRDQRLARRPGGQSAKAAPSMLGRSPRRKPLRSMPAQNEPPAPVRMPMRRSSLASSSSTAAAMPRATARLIALRACGRLMVMVRMPSARSTRTSAASGFARSWWRLLRGRSDGISAAPCAARHPGGWFRR